MVGYIENFVLLVFVTSRFDCIACGLFCGSFFATIDIAEMLVRYNHLIYLIRWSVLRRLSFTFAILRLHSVAFLLTGLTTSSHSWLLAVRVCLVQHW